MKKFSLFTIALFQTLLCKAHVCQGFENFYHDASAASPAILNRCFLNINALFNPPINPYLNLANSTYHWYFSHPPVVGNYWNQNIAGNALVQLTIPQQATLAINRFCIGITNYNNVPAFHDLQGLVDAFAGLPAAQMQQALLAGGYDTTSARFLHTLLNPGGIPIGITGGAGSPNETVALVLKLQHRASKDLKEIHWSSVSGIAVNLALWQNILQALPLPPPPMVPVPAYVSIKQRINNPFLLLMLASPHSATFVIYDETSIN